MQTTGAALLAVKRCSLARVLTPAQDSLSRRTFELTEQGQVTDRFTKAIEQLGSDKLDVRLGGIYALERVARDSAKDHPTVMEVLTAFIREHSREEWLTSEGGQPTQEGSTRPDIQAAVTVVGRRDTEHDILRIDLAAADLTHAILTFAVLTRADLTAAVLAGRTSPAVQLDGANLTGAHLDGANLTHAVLRSVRLRGVRLGGLRDVRRGPGPAPGRRARPRARQGRHRPNRAAR